MFDVAGMMVLREHQKFGKEKPRWLLCLVKPIISSKNKKFVGPRRAIRAHYCEMNANSQNQEQANRLTIQLERQTDNELLILYVDHQSEAAFNELVSRHSKMVLSVCLAVVSDRNRADDAFQATFLALIRNARRLRKSTSFAGWLYRVAYHAALKVLKMQQKENQADHFDAVVEIDPLRQIAAREVIQALVVELDTIPKRYREVLTLFYFEQLSRSEIADRLDCSVITVKSLLQRGKQHLKRRLLRKGIVPSMVFLGVLAANQSVKAACISKLVKTTVANCIAGSATASIPSQVTCLAKAGEWTMLTSNSVVIKSICFAFGILSIAIVPLLFVEGASVAQEDEKVTEIRRDVREQNAPGMLDVIARQEKKDAQELKKTTDFSKVKTAKLQTYDAQLVTEIKALEAKRDALNKDNKTKVDKTGKNDALAQINSKLKEKKQLLSKVRNQLALKLLAGDIKEFRKFAKTTAGQQTLIAIYLAESLKVDSTIDQILGKKTNNSIKTICIQPSGMMSSTGTAPGINRPISNVQVKNDKTIDLMYKIQRELGTLKVTDVSLPAYAHLKFTFEKEGFSTGSGGVGPTAQHFLRIKPADKN